MGAAIGAAGAIYGAVQSNRSAKKAKKAAKKAKKALLLPFDQKIALLPAFMYKPFQAGNPEFNSLQELIKRFTTRKPGEWDKDIHPLVEAGLAPQFRGIDQDYARQIQDAIDAALRTGDASAIPFVQAALQSQATGAKRGLRLEGLVKGKEMASAEEATQLQWLSQIMNYIMQGRNLEAGASAAVIDTELRGEASKLAALGSAFTAIGALGKK